ncbi:MAG: hypothetical protein C0519_03630 [Hyphomicrobium sp.]|nr:hypothetical protein [Hyphomicrobium sp.]PPD07368.1 MAG: hypothetical protein CTY28_09690 [Hyphomicrobium sp.]
MRRCAKRMKRSKRHQAKAKLPSQNPESGTAKRSQTTEQPSSAEIRAKVETALEPVIGQGNGSKTAVVERVVSLMQAEVFRGPLPHPKHLEAYERVCPGISDRLVGMAEFAQERQEARLDKIVDGEFRDRTVGLVLGWLALLSLVAAGTILTLAGHVAVGSGLFVASVLGAVIKPFIDGRNRPEENDEPTSDDQRRK